MKIDQSIRKYLTDLGISERTVNIFEANCEDLALEMLKLYANLKKDADLETKESRKALVDTYVRKNPDVEYIKKDIIYEPEIVDGDSESSELADDELDEFQGDDETESLINLLSYMDILNPKGLKFFILDEMTEDQLKVVTRDKLRKEEVEFLTPSVVFNKVHEELDSWIDELGLDNFDDVDEEYEINKNHLSEEVEYKDMEYHPGLPKFEFFNLTPEDIFNNKIQSHIRYVMDYVDNPKDSKGLGGELKDETFQDLQDASKNWHKSLGLLERIALNPTKKGDDIVSDIDSEESNQIVIDYRIGGKGYYWANLNEHFSAQEQRRMAHCGRCMHTLYSFRSILDATVTGIPNHEDVTKREDLFSDKKIEGHTVSRSHFTVSLGNDGIIYQMKAAENVKVPTEFHKYVVDLLITKNLPVLGGKIDKIIGFGYEYDNGNDFTFDQMEEKSLVLKLYKERKDLFTEGPRNMSDVEMENFMHKFNLPYQGPSKTQSPRHHFWQKPKNYVMTDREKQENEKIRNEWKKYKEENDKAEEPQKKPWWKIEEKELENVGWQKAEYVYSLKNGGEKKFSCKYDPVLNIFTDVNDDEFFADEEVTDIKEEYVLYKGKKIKDARIDM